MNETILGLDGSQELESITDDGIAIVGMSGRFPGASDVRAFWSNLCKGVDSISHFSESELEDTFSAEVRASSDFVRARSILEHADMFDAEFFGMLPREAMLTDPQQRVFLECCWEALEDAGHDPASYSGMIGVFAGCSLNTYLLKHVCGDRSAIDKFTSDFQVGSYQELMGSLQDFVATRVSYKLDLKGPSIDVQSACSTSLVAIAQACQSLALYQADMALAGGVSITFPQRRGYLSLEGGMCSPDGRCRPFDANAGGTVFGSGAGVVLLKRLADAIADRDHIYAVIRGHALNNDGAAKAGFAAPSVDGQAAVIATAQAVAGVNAREIGYVECHGTATPLGDPIEFAGLVKAFRETSQEKNYCFLGSAKANVGHLDSAAGVTGVVKAALTLHEEKIPPLLHYHAPNPHIDLDSSPFKINKEMLDWPRGPTPRLAGVSAFGVGGTNAHVVMQEAPEFRTAADDRAQLLVLSARTPTARQRMSENLGAHLQSAPDANLADVAWTLQAGRREFEYGRAVVARDIDDAVDALSQGDADRIQDGRRPQFTPRVYFMFPGQGAQYVGMGRGLYRQEPQFREAFDLCSDILTPLLGVDLRGILFCDESGVEQARARLTDTAIAQPAIFAIEYALAQLWMSWGVHPSAMIGHSIGEFVAATLAGVFSLEDALAMVAARGRLMHEAPRGGMLSVRLPEERLQVRLNGKLSIAAVNAPSICVVSGPIPELEILEAALRSEKIVTRRLVTSHAFHSSMMDPAVEEFGKVVAGIGRNKPTIPILSTATGDWLTDSQATDPDYWARHLRNTVRFSTAVAKARAEEGVALLEVGPGNTLNILARQHARDVDDQVIASSLGGPGASESDTEAMLQALGALWLAGVHPDWASVHGVDANLRRRVSLPTYPFERKRYWIDAKSRGAAETAGQHPIVIPQPTASNPGAGDLVMQYQAKPSAPAPAPTAAATNVGNGSRAASIRASLVQLFEELSGMELSAVGEGVSFIELGFDSLFLTQATRALKNKFDLKITFRQLLDDLSTFSALAQFADSKLPADAFAEPAAPVAPPQPAAIAAPSVQAAPAVASQLTSQTVSYGNGAAISHDPRDGGFAPASDSIVERVLREQMQVMSQVFATQLNALRGEGGAALASTPQPVPQAGEQAKIYAAESKASPVLSALRSTEKKSETQNAAALGPFKPLQAAGDGGLTDLQRVKLDELIARFTKRTQKSKSLTQAHRKRLADPRVVSGFRADWKELVYPITISRSKGSRLWDVDGNEYIDLLNGFGPIMFGHRPDFVEQALIHQLSEGIEIGPQTPLAGEIAEMFCEMTGNERMTFCNTGSEAVMAALRVARTVTGRDKVVMFTGDYHGMFDEVLIKASKTKDNVPAAAPTAPGIPRESVANMIVLDYGTPDTLEWIRQNVGDLAAVLVEPVQSRRPHFQPVEFLKQLREITAKASTALIFDEVVTGFRTHPGGCQALFDIRADMATYGKVVGGGMPIGILAGKAEYMDALDGGYWRFGDNSVPEVGVTFFAGTFVRHPLTLAAVKAVLIELKKQGRALQDQLATRTTDMVARINAILEKHEIPTRLNNYTSVIYFGFAPTEKFSSIFYYLLREQGVHVLEGFPCFLTTAHSDEDIDHIVRAFETAAIETRKANFFGPTDRATIEALPARSADEPVPMTEPQREIFLAAMLGDDVSCAFNESMSVYFDGPLQVIALRDALNALVTRHEALRATIAADGAHLLIGAAPRIDIGAIRDLSNLSPQDRDAEFKRLLAEDARRPFSLTEGPLFRAELVRLADEQHVLVISFHHIVCDGWSSNVLLEELAELYSARVENRTVSLPPALSFRDYAVTQAQGSDAAEDAEVEAYWLEKFKNPSPPLDMPTDRPRSSIRSYAGATLRHHIGKDVYHSLKQFGAKQGASLFATLFAGFNALLYRLTQQSDIVVGVPMAGQSLVDGGALVGHCVNFLPLRTQVFGDETFTKLLSDVKETVLDSVERQRYTYGTLVRKLNIIRDPSRLPLTELQFNVEQLGSGVTFSGLQARAEPNPKGAVNSDIFVNIIEREDGLMIDCDYNTDLYDESTISAWLDGYEGLLTAAAGDPGTNVASLPLPAAIGAPVPKSGGALSPEAAANLVDWNATGAAYPSDRSIVALFEEQAARAPDAPALIMNDTVVSYGELNRRANKLAHHLVRLGAKPEEMIASCIERSPDLVVSLLGILKAGCAYVPLEPTLPLERLKFIVEDTKARILVTTKQLAESAFSWLEAPPVLIDQPESAVWSESDQNLDSRVGPNSLAYVMYTSGSTGTPKGVMIEHRSVVRLVRNTNFCHFGPDMVTLQFAPVSFDASTFEIWGALLNGGQVAIVPPGEPSLAELGRIIREKGVTTAWLTAGLFHLMVDQRLDDLGSLQQLLAGGDVLSAAHVARVVERFPKLRMVNGYGPTEGTTFTCCHAFEPGRPVTDPVPIGKPISNTRVYILEADLKQTPIGAEGELCVAGDGLARGYLNNSELTAEKFISLAMSNGMTERLYRSGDRARFLSDGSIQFLGRIDHQVKLRGYRIELGEIEAALQSHAGVRQACVVADREEGRVKRLVAFCLSDEGERPDEAALRQYLSAKLPEYMAPAAIVFVDAFPLTANGKIDRDKLLSLEKARREREEIIAPNTPEETLLVDIVREVMQIEHVGVTSNLFEIGVDSLKMFQIASRATKAGIAITPRAILQARTIRAALEQAALAPVAGFLDKIKPAARRRVVLGAPSGSAASVEG